MANKKTPEDWGEDFRARRPHVHAFTEELRRLLDHLLEEAGIDAQVEHRTKEVDSFVDKIRRKNEKYRDPLLEITDQCGLRIVAYYLEDVETIGELIDQQFKIDWGNSVRYRPDSDPERFGYRSDQYVASLSEERRDLLEWRKYRDDVAEIQIRTIMQHAWAAVDHKVRYKARDLPVEVRRRLSRLSALLETADEQFSAVRRESQEVEAGYRKSIDAHDLDVSLDVLSLRGYLQSTLASVDWAKRAMKLGFLTYQLWDFISDDPESYLAEEDLERPLRAFEIGKKKTLSDVHSLLEEAETWGEDLLAVTLKHAEQQGFPPYAVPKDILTFLALFDAEHLSAISRFDYKDEIASALAVAIRQKKHPTQERSN